MTEGKVTVKMYRHEWEALVDACEDVLAVYTEQQCDVIQAALDKSAREQRKLLRASVAQGVRTRARERARKRREEREARREQN